METNNADENDECNLDNTLIESLFYNEMMLMEESPSLLLSILSADGTPSVDTNTLMGTSLWGQLGSPSQPLVPQPAHVPQYPQHQQAQQEPPKLESTLATPNPLVTVSRVTSYQNAEGAAAAPPSAPEPLVPQMTLPSSTAKPSTMDEAEKRKKLVSQFATMASRLGIHLPPQVLRASMEGRQVAVPALATPTGDSTATVPPASPFPVISGDTASLQPIVQELQSTAEAAIAAVSKKHPLEENASSAKQPTYSKRRKKASLGECERRLASLQAENSLLKRHLHNIANKSAALQTEQKAAEAQIRHLWSSNATQQQLDAAVNNLTELYSDYGKRRQDELSFHLEQLRRLANPTNVTKMGLWALGQQSVLKKNPIAGMLQKELDITAQQGRKIVEQREKIRHVSSNLKECLDLLGKLQTLCEKKTNIFHDRMSKCREILTPRQVVKLILWIHDHAQVLENVCPGWGSETLHS
ncbi:hypothetical protein FisN_7Hh330 [Fistulifera solaris]|uniref:BZIP domain-containing protein n=1 Tax=Fistulifera solaris TaxID=1519565 RepID=A0A1Z5KSA9_FISSO|nr:hypothetical protein FisN_7Hh330 [Fistulifera solaris]|eukprot:GAX29077.1 hypothetical protein FisN_7Hh330 [Fistulifera solaris]